MAKECYSCGGREGGAEFPKRKNYRERRVCCACLAISIEINPNFVDMQRERIEGDGGLFAQVTAE